jgi:proton-dependent oligopeptide transporter, POT family
MALEEGAVVSPGTLRVRTFFGQPWPLLYLAFTEAWERFSFYGMGGLLTLYLSQQLLLPGHVEHVAGFSQFRGALQSLFGPMTTLALASQIFGLYFAFVYFTPVIGGYLADRYIGRRRAVVMGAVLMSGGHIAMAFDQSFLIALLLLIVGCGFLKGNISTQVGALYAAGDSAGRTRGFAIFSTAINIGAVVGPFLCGLLAQLWGWHAGFGLAGVLMLLGLATYLAGYRQLAETDNTVAPAETAPAHAHDWRVVAALFAVIAISIFQSIAYYQCANIGLVWVDKHVDLDLLGFDIPAAWFNSLQALFSIVCVPFLFALWRWQAKHGGEPGEMAKIATGAFLSAAANAVLVLAAALSERTILLSPILFYALQGVGFIYYWPTMLALVSRAAPARLVATMIGVLFLSLFVSNNIIGWLGTFYEQMTPAAFWGLHMAIGAAGGLLALVFKRPLERVLLH